MSKISEKELQQQEKYYWEQEDCVMLPKHELSDYHLCNIVAKFGKNWLIDNGHEIIVRRFETLNREHDFFKEVK